LFRANYDDLVSYALRRVGPEAATDVVAEVFLIAWRRRNDLPQGAERQWLYGVAANVIANETRGALRQARLRSRISATVPPDGFDPGDVASTGIWVRAVLATLPAAEQEALRLIEWDQLDIAEAAAVMGCSRATFRVRLHRARKRFAARLTASDPAITRSVRS
jgi:RNA polymerase sigma-70 factor (ECF subfamily)